MDVKVENNRVSLYKERLIELAAQLHKEIKEEDDRSVYWEFLSRALYRMALDGAQFDKLCTLCIADLMDEFNWAQKWLGSTRGNERGQDDLERVTILFYRFLSEYKFNTFDGISDELFLIFKFVEFNFDKFSKQTQSNFLYADNSLPGKFSKYYLDEFKALKLDEVMKARDDFANEKKSWVAYLDAEKKKVDALQAVIQKQTSDSNFVALNQGFADMRKQKKAELCWAQGGLLLLGFLLLALPSIQLLGLGNLLHFSTAQAFARDQTSSPVLSVWLTWAPLLACELILLYFFRVTLGQYRSVKAQLVQLDLRIALCRFIEAYTEHMVAIREKGSDVLQRFEALIFSGLMTEGERIPSVLDGSEQLAQLLRSIQSKG